MNFIAGLFLVASVALAVLKLANVIAVSWLVVFLPAIVAAVLFIIGLIITLVVYKVVKKKVTKSPLWQEMKF